MSVSRPPSPPSNAAGKGTVEIPAPVQVTVEPSSPMSPSSTDSASGIASPRGSSDPRRTATFTPTNTLIITPLPLAFFEPKILDALKSHFASYSTTFIHRNSPYSPASASGPGASIKGSRQNVDADASAPGGTESGDKSDEQMDDNSLEGDLYSFVPLKSFKRAIVVFYSAEDAERARIASDKLHIPATPRSPAVTMRAFRGPETVLVEEGWFPSTSRKDGQGIGDDAEEGSWYFGGYPMLLSGTFDDGEIRESPFHLRPPVPERNFLISPPGSPPVGWVPAREDPPNEIPLAEDLVEALERLRAQRAARSRKRRSPRHDALLLGRSHSISTDGSSTHSEEEGVMLIPESAAGLCVRVEDWGSRRLTRMHQERQKGKRRRTYSNSKDAPELKKARTSDEERERGPLTDMEEDLDQELETGRFGAQAIHWNRRDHARVKAGPLSDSGDSDSEMGIRVEGPEEDGSDMDSRDSPFLSQDHIFRSGQSITVKMPKLGAKPKPASMPPLLAEGEPSGAMLGFKPTAMPPLKPTDMPPLHAESSF